MIKECRINEAETLSLGWAILKEQRTHDLVRMIRN